MTTATEVRIVDATRDHIPFVAWVVMASNRSHLAKGMWDLSLGMDEEGVLRYLEVLADTDTMHWGHHSLFKVAEVDGVPAAGMCGFFENELGPATMMAGAAEVNQKTGRTAEDVAAGWERSKAILGIVIEHEPGAWVVEHVATKAEFRRRGLVERLVHEMLGHGRERGATVADIGVLIGNDAAQRAYEKCGFVVVEEKRDATFEAAYGSPGARMLRRPV
ncbi:MAG TPA: GNAT family N-acetyltransferase [Dehalococcoidia bacterium]|jgi:ribosomal protein S18 acetylase RimI-like enzyme|nr:GNAT family N-acetyltransferase [Dehalococcoidia bacterium]